MGNREQCEEYFCKGKKLNEVNLYEDAEKCGLYREANQIIKRLAMHADSLLMNVDNNVCEQFNSIINKHLAGKRIHFSLRQSYATRIESGVISYNTLGQLLRSLHKHVVHKLVQVKIIMTNIMITYLHPTYVFYIFIYQISFVYLFIYFILCFITLI